MAAPSRSHTETPDSRAAGTTTPLDNRGRSSLFGVRDYLDHLDYVVTASRLGRFFYLAGCGHPREAPDATFLREIRAGLTTFATMAYIIAVNVSAPLPSPKLRADESEAALLSQTGGTCMCEYEDRGLCDNVPSYVACKEDVRRDLITATAAISGMASISFGLLTNLPVALAPGMGLNAYFTYQVVGYNGGGRIPYRMALTAVFVEGLVFIFLALTGMRQWLVKLIPSTLKTATGVGIGFFLTEIGLSYSAGIGAITGGWISTPLALGGCPQEDVSIHTGMCVGGLMSSVKLWIAVLCGGVFTAFLMAFRVKYALMLGIALVSIISWPRGTPMTYFPYDEPGQARFEFFKNVVDFHPIERTLNQLDWTFESNGGQFALALFTFLYVDIIDATATLYSMARFCGVVNRDDGDFPRSTLAYCTDAAFISIGALFGSSPVTAFIESGAGIAEGGRTGLTAVVTGLCFIISIFFAPIFASIPPWATGCTLVLVGCMMIRQVTQINWRYIGDVLPSFIVMTFIPFSYSVAYGLIAGIFIYAVLNGLIGLVVVVSRGRCEPREYDLKEYWSWKSAGQAPWFVSTIRKMRRRQSTAVSTDEHLEASSSLDRQYSPSQDQDSSAGRSRESQNKEASHLSVPPPVRTPPRRFVE